MMNKDSQREAFTAVLTLIRNDFEGNEYLSSKAFSESAIAKILDEHNLWTYLHIQPKTSISPLFVERAHANLMVSKEAYNTALHIVSELDRKTSEIDLRFVVVKGIALTDCLYENVGNRSFGDIDILVPTKDAEAFHGILGAMGYFQEVGPSSKKSLDRQGLALIALHAAKKPAPTPFPVKMNQNKPEYKPYTREGSPTIEVHDGMYYLPSYASTAIFSEGRRVDKEDCAYWASSIIHTFILLITNTYSNSESFFSNSYDFKLTLRDYVDIRYFFKKYQKALDWHLVENTIEDFGIQDITGIVLGNLLEVYGYDVSLGCLPRIRLLPSKWGVRVLERMKDNNLSRIISLRVMRERWLAEGTGMPIYARDVSSENIEFAANYMQEFICNDGMFYSVQHTSSDLILSFSLPPNLCRKQDILYQFKFYPLTDALSYTIYKVNIYLIEGNYVAYGHSTIRNNLGAVRKKLGLELRVVCKEINGREFVRIKLPFSEFEPLDVTIENSLCISCEIYEQHYREIYHRFRGNTDDEEIHLLVLK